jgi:3D (Asp-Asp-Asp) domain-containing protein
MFAEKLALKTRIGEPDLMTRSTFVGSALSVLFVFSVISYSKTFLHSQEPKLAQTTLPNVLEVAGQIPEPRTATTAAEVSAETGSAALGNGSASTASGSDTGARTDFVVAAQTYVATAYSLRGRTASGRYVSRGLIAADPSVLPLGSRVLVEAGSWSGEYLVADTGGAVKGRRIDIWTPTSREALQFGRRTVKLTVLEFGGKRARPALGRPRLVNPAPVILPAAQQQDKQDR